MPKVQYAGVPIDAGDTVLIVPPLSLGQLRANQVKLSLIEDSSVPAGVRVQAKFDMVCDAIRRNYPEITDEELLPRLDLVSIHSAFSAALGVPAERTKGE